MTDGYMKNYYISLCQLSKYVSIYDFIVLIQFYIGVIYNLQHWAHQYLDKK